MTRQFLIAAVLICQCAWSALAASAVGFHLQMFPLTGEIQLRNKNASPLVFDYFSIQSDGGTLDPAPSVWRSISDTYDASGNGFIDPSQNWTKLASTAVELTEGVFTGSGGTLLANRAISLGNIWNPLAPFDLEVDIESNGMPITVTVEYALTGDYFRDGVVDQLDYNLWRQNAGSTTSLDADGNLNGVIDAADFVLWRDNLGLSIPSLSVGPGATSATGSAIGIAAVVPEPPAALLLVVALIALSGCIVRIRALRF